MEAFSFSNATCNAFEGMRPSPPAAVPSAIRPHPSVITAVTITGAGSAVTRPTRCRPQVEHYGATRVLARRPLGDTPPIMSVDCGWIRRESQSEQRNPCSEKASPHNDRIRRKIPPTSVCRCFSAPSRVSQLLKPSAAAPLMSAAVPNRIRRAQTCSIDDLRTFIDSVPSLVETSGEGPAPPTGSGSPVIRNTSASASADVSWMVECG